MAITNSDGSPYQLSGTLNIFDPSFKANSDYLSSVISEEIKIFGSPILYYEVLINPQNIDETYLEDRSKLYSSTPVELFAMYEPNSPNTMLSSFGIESGSMDTIFSLSYTDVLHRLGNKMPTIGSRIYTPHLRENWSVVSVQVDDFKLWGKYMIKILAAKWQASKTDNSMLQNASARTTTNYPIT